MILVRLAGERVYSSHRRRDVWRTIPRADELEAERLAGLDAIDELRLPPGAALPGRPLEAEIVTYVREGALLSVDPRGAVRRVLAGEFQRRAGSGRVRYSESNASSSEWAHVFRLWLRPATPLVDPAPDSGPTERRFTAGLRRGALHVVAAPDGPALAAKLTTRARVASALLRRGQHVVHMLEPGHSAWLHVVVGTVLLGELALTTGDGVALLDELALSVTARGDCELLLVELEPRAASGRPRVSSH
jgi:redox-sensitive bicupin YhaK (pirin superfamily)